MTTIFIDENYGSDGDMTDEKDFMDAAATVFLGSSCHCIVGSLSILNTIGGSDTARKKHSWNTRQVFISHNKRLHRLSQR